MHGEINSIRGGRRLRSGAGLLQPSNRMAGIALGDDVARTTLATAALGGNTQLHLNVVKAQAGTRVTGNLLVGDSAADTNNHGKAMRW